MKRGILLTVCAGILATSTRAHNDKDSLTKVVRSLTGFKVPIQSLQFSPSGRELVSSNLFETVLWDVESGKMLKKRKDGGVAIYSVDGKHIFIGSTVKPLTRLDAATWDATELKPHEGTIECLAVSSDGKHLLCGGAKEHKFQSPGALSLWSAKDGKHLQNLEGHRLPVKGVAFVPGAFQALSFSPDATFRLWDLAKGKELQRLGTPVTYNNDSQPLPLAIFKDGISFTTGYYLYEIDGLALKRKLDLTMQERSDSATCVAISPNQKIIAVGNRSGLVRLWYAQTGKLIDTFTAQTNKARLNAIAFSPDGQFIATAGDGSIPGQPGLDFTIRIWRTPDA